MEEGEEITVWTYPEIRGLDRRRAWHAVQGDRVIRSHGPCDPAGAEAVDVLEAVRPLALQLRASGRQFRDALADFPADAWEGRLGEEATNHAAYVALHLLDARCFLLRSLDVDAFHASKP